MPTAIQSVYGLPPARTLPYPVWWMTSGAGFTNNVPVTLPGVPRPGEIIMLTTGNSGTNGLSVLSCAGVEWTYITTVGGVGSNWYWVEVRIGRVKTGGSDQLTLAMSGGGEYRYYVAAFRGTQGIIPTYAATQNSGATLTIYPTQGWPGISYYTSMDRYGNFGRITESGWALLTNSTTQAAWRPWSRWDSTGVRATSSSTNPSRVLLSIF